MSETAAAAPVGPVFRTPWWMVLIQGIAAGLLGLAFFFRPGLSSVALAQAVGLWWLLSGIVTVASLFGDRTAWGWRLAKGVLGMVVGAMVIAQPALSPVVLGTTFVLLIGVQGLVIGVVDLFEAFTGGGRGIGILGVLSVFLGGFLIARPLEIATLLPWVFGAVAVGLGAWAVLLSLRLRDGE